MRTIKRLGEFKRDYKRALRGLYGKTLEDDLKTVFKLLQFDQPLPKEYDDHQMRGDMKDLRNCHIHGDLVLLYRKVDADLLQLVRLGSHSQLGI